MKPATSAMSGRPTTPTAFLDPHLNVYWLRPEAALWDAIASNVVSAMPFVAPVLDLGSGNGIFSFITAGGVFAPEYDWYRNVNPRGFWENRDIYDAFLEAPRAEWIASAPAYQIDYAVDAKRNLLRQALGLGFYRAVVAADANVHLPFPDDTFETVFSNILYWLDSAERSLTEVRRVLRPGGRALLCLQHPRFRETCFSYGWRESGSTLLRLLNRGRAESSRWTVTYPELVALAATLRLRIVAHAYYLSPLTLRLWDVGLRPLSPVLIKMVQKLNPADYLAIKAEWIETVRPFLAELCDLDARSMEPKGFHFVCLEKV